MYKSKVSIFLIAFGSFFLVECTTEATERKEVNAESLRKKNAPTQVATVLAEKKPFNYQIHSNGVVVAAKEAELIFKVGGALNELYVKEGDYVQKGDVLAKLDNTVQTLALQKAEINLKERQLEYQNQLLATGGRGDSAQMAQVQLNLAYITGLKTAELDFKQAQLVFNQTTIRAPFTGVVSNVEVNKEAVIKAGTPICTLSSNASLLVKTAVLESVIGRVKLGQQVIIKPLALAATYAANVRTINPRVDKNGVVKLVLKVIHPKGLLPGMHVAIVIHAPYNKNIIIPETALVIRSGKEVVFVAEDGLAKWKYVTTGLKSNNQVEVLEGLNEGDDVIITNNIYLAHDAPITNNH